MSRWIRNLLLGVFLTCLSALAPPYIQAFLYAGHLASLPAPKQLDIPVERVRAGALRDSWHAVRPGGRRHEGIDIFAPWGTPVHSSTEGIVARIGSSRLGGRVVWVVGPGLQSHYYAHLSRFADIYPGQRIGVGTVLGYVGNTGNARGTPPHLHYGIYTRAAAINPYPLLHDERGHERFNASRT